MRDSFGGLRGEPLYTLLGYGFCTSLLVAVSLGGKTLSQIGGYTTEVQMESTST